MQGAYHPCRRLALCRAPPPRATPPLPDNAHAPATSGACPARSLLLWFGIEISRDWLVASAFKLTRTEYTILWLTFGAIMQWGLEGGIMAGIVLATTYFA